MAAPLGPKGGCDIGVQVAQHAAEWDVVVIGAGPAGCTAAFQAARSGLRVLLVDKARFPRFKVCGCCLSAAAIGLMDQIGITQAMKACWGPALNEVSIRAGRRRLDLPLPGGMAVSRARLDEALVAAARDVGATFLDQHAARLGPVENEARLVHLAGPGERRAVRAAVVVVAEGIAGRTVTSPPAAGSHMGLAAVIKAGRNSPPAGRVTMCCAPGGYVGMVGIERDRVAIAAAISPAHVREAGGPVAAIRSILDDTRTERPAGLDQAAIRGTPLLTREPKQIAGDRWLAVGDAAGYVEPFTGEGMPWAIASAAETRSILFRAARRGWSSVLETEWTARHQRLIRRRQRRCRAIAMVLRSPRLTGFALTALSLSPEFARTLPGRIHGPWTLDTPVQVT